MTTYEPLREGLVTITTFGVPNADDDRAGTASRTAASTTVEPASPCTQLLTVEQLTGERTGWRLAGEIDAGNHELLEKTLDQLATEPHASTGVAHLDLAALSFIDMRGTQLLVQAANRFHDNCGGRLVLHHPPYTLRRIAGLLLDGLDIDDHATLTLPATSASSAAWC
ncbi:MAG: STAS domain-containing protein [Nocardioidaceae bacterium]